MSTEELDSNLDLILDSLPDERDGVEKRKHALTKRDGEFIAKLVKLAVSNQGCSIGLSEQQMNALKEISPSTFKDIKEMVKERRRALNALGLLTLAVLGWFGKWIFENIEWGKIWHFVFGK